MSANIIIGKHKTVNTNPESVEIINYSLIFH